MYNYNQYADLISRLQKLPKLGQTPNDAGQRDVDRTEQQIKSELDGIAQIYERGTNTVKLYNDQIQLLSDNFGNLQHGLSVVTVSQEAYNSSLTDLVKDVTFFDQIEANLAKTLKITTGEAYKQTQTYGTFLETLKTTRAALDTYRTTLNGILPGQSANIAASKEYAQTLLATQQHLQDFQGLTADQAASYTLYTEGGGKNIATQIAATQQLAKEWEDSTGLVGQYNVVLTEISSMAADIRSEYSRTNGELELAVLKTKRLGMTMSQLDKIGTGLLNIEESVGQEIEFQLISGKRLVDAQGRSITNKFREAKLTGDSLKMTEAMTDVITEQGEIITGNNFLAKKALADSLGLSVQELVVAKSRYDLTKKLESTKKITKKELDELKPGSEAEKKFTAALEHEVKIAGTKEARDAAKANLKALSELKDINSNLESPAQKAERHLQNIVDNGIFMKMPKEQIKNKNGETTGTRYAEKPEFDFQAFAETVKTSKTNEIAQTAGFLKLVGQTQTIGKLVDADKTLLTSLAGLTPGFSAFTKAITSLEAAVEKNFPALGAAIKGAMGVMPGSVKGKGTKYTGAFSHGPAPSVEDTHDLSIDANGGPIVMSLKENRIFQGTKNDDVAMYPGAVDVATANNTTKNYNTTNNTEKVNYNKIENTVEAALQSQLGKLNIKPNITINNTDTNKVVNADTRNLENTMRSVIKSEIAKIDSKNIINVDTNKNNKSNVDLEKIASMFRDTISKLNVPTDNRNIISAIKTAFADVQISVHVDPIKIDKEIKFRNTRINT